MEGNGRNSRKFFEIPRFNPGFVHPLGSKRCTGKKKTEYSHDFRFEARRDESCFNSGTR